MDIVLIGAGRVAGAFAPFLCQLGQLQLWDRTLEHAKALAQRVDAKVVENYLNVQGDVAFVAVSDKAIAQVAHTFAGRFKVALHTSGFHPSSVLKPMAQSVGSLHPWLPIPKQDPSLLVNAIATFEGNQVAGRFAEQLAQIIPLRLYHIDSSKKVVYHTAAVMLSNYTDLLMIKAGELLDEAGINDENQRKTFIKEIVQNTLDNYIEIEKDSLTGPAVRKDMDVIEAETKALSGLWADAYSVLSNIIMKGEV
jgi:predicted short-subunit dehydrogenase-like oxidoreductase (DUF2520 family)